MAAVRPAGPEPTMRSLVSVRPGPPFEVEGPPGAGAGSSSPKAMVSGERGAGAYGAATEVSPEKSMVMPPKGLVSLPDSGSGTGTEAGAGRALVASPDTAIWGLLPFFDSTAFASTGRVCLLIDASIA